MNIAGTAQASNLLTMTQTSATSLDFSISLPGLSDSSTLAIANGNASVVLNAIVQFADPPDANEDSVIAWIDPGNSSLYNIMATSASNNLGITTFQIFVDQDATELATISLHQCISGGSFVACPVLANGQTITVPYRSEGLGTGSIDVRFLDRADAGAAPLPAALPLFASGAGGIGLIVWRRRRKDKTAPVN